MTFYNTVDLAGEDLKKAVADAQKQEDSIFLIFFHTRKKYTAFDITKLTEKAGKRWPLWSNRRALTNLKSEKKLVILKDMKKGPQGKPEHFYQLDFNTYPTISGTQSALFTPNDLRA